jgi:branched-chain amino acid aminotransferase
VKVWVNGLPRDEAAAVVSVFDHGLTVGDGVFETLVVRAGTPFALTRHLRRLAASAAGLGLPRVDLDRVRGAIDETLAANDVHPRSRLRVTYTAGTASLGSDRDAAEPTLVVAVQPAPPAAPAAAAITVPYRRNERGALTGLKTTSYAENALALARAKAAGASEALFADTMDRLSEGTGSNVFVVVDGRLLTPSPRAGCLAGVTRGLVLEWSEGAAEADLPFEVLEHAEEIFLTSTLRDVQAVHTLDGRPLPAPGPVTRRIQEIFSARAAAEPDPS